MHDKINVCLFLLYSYVCLFRKCPRALVRAVLRPTILVASAVVVELVIFRRREGLAADRTVELITLPLESNRRILELSIVTSSLVLRDSTRKVKF